MQSASPTWMIDARPSATAGQTARLALAGLLAAWTGLAWAGGDAALEQGHAVFEAHCVICHGANADGTGQLARLLTPPPANLRLSVLNDPARNAIVRGGGASVGRSPAMPRWEAELSEEELQLVIAYVASVAPKQGTGSQK